MDRQAKLTLLLTMADAEVLVASLNSAEHARHAAATPAASRQPRDAGLRSQANETPSAEEAALSGSGNGASSWASPQRISMPSCTTYGVDRATAMGWRWIRK